MQPVVESLARELVPFGSTAYGIMLGLMIFARGMDLLSTWTGTPTLALEANPIARWLGWKLGIVVNLVLCGFVARLPLMAVVIVTTSMLVAARNFKSAWLMRTMGENHYLAFILNQMSCARRSLVLFCLLGEAALFTCIGIALLLTSPLGSIPMGIGVGVLAYALAITIFTSWPLLRSRIKHP
ncbi:MAG: hypothetical protein ACKVHO_06470 [Verrucomicrobiia bacterium]|jgi:hypothetical protein